MQKFNCKAMTPQGQIVEFKMQENDKMVCLKKMKRNGMTPISVEPSFTIFKKKKNKRNLTATIHANKKRKSIFVKAKELEVFNKITIDEIKEFTYDLYILRKSNFSINHAILTILNKTENHQFKECLSRVLRDIESGKYLYKALREHSDVFPMVYVNLIKTGELTNSLDESLGYALRYLEAEVKVKNKIKNILIPNIIAFMGIILMLAVAVLIIIPNLQRLFLSYGTTITLPKFVSIANNIFYFVGKYWYIFIILLVGISYSFIKFMKTEKGRYKIDTFKYKNFLLGKLLYLFDFSRIIRSIYLNLENRMRTQDALEISKNITKNTYMYGLIENAINNIYIGKPWLDAFDDEKLLNPITLELLKKGTKKKTLHNFEVAIDYLDKDIEKEINKVLKRLPEISYAFVGIALFIFIITILIPCMQIYLSGLLFI